MGAHIRGEGRHGAMRLHRAREGIGALVNAVPAAETEGGLEAAARALALMPIGRGTEPVLGGGCGYRLEGH